MGLLDATEQAEIKYPWWVEEFAEEEFQLAKAQVANVRAQQEFQAEQFGRLEGELEAEQAARAAAAGGAEGLLDTTRDLVEAQAEAAARGVEATPEQRALIEEQARQALAAGESDIRRFLAETGETLREELSPTLGLRPTDSPILDRGERARTEAIRQQGQLVRGIRGAQAQQLLEFPLQAAGVETGQRVAGAQLSEAARQFQEQLRQQAFQNRMALTGQVGTQGLQLASLGGNVPVVSSGGTTTVSDPIGQITGLAGGAGGLLTGVGDIL